MLWLLCSFCARCWCLYLCVCCSCMCLFFFFFQAEDGIRDVAVTGVQTCALPIYPEARRSHCGPGLAGVRFAVPRRLGGTLRDRSEERRVGKEGRSRWVGEEEKKKKEGRER